VCVCVCVRACVCVCVCVCMCVLNPNGMIVVYAFCPQCVPLPRWNAMSFDLLRRLNRQRLSSKLSELFLFLLFRFP
jgi:hypothetical protein